jgi:hypothetical protein
MTEGRVGRWFVRVTHVSTNGAPNVADPVHPMHRCDVASEFERSLVPVTHRTADIQGLVVANGRHAHREKPRGQCE